MIGQCFRRRHLSVAALALFAVTACGSEAADTAEATGGAAPTAASQAGRAADSAGTAAASGQAGRTMTESDRLFLEMAEGGCNAVDFPSFFKAFSGSWAVREKYTAAMVTQGMTGKSSAQPRGAYLDRNDFPIAPMDYEFVTAESAARVRKQARRVVARPVLCPAGIQHRERQPAPGRLAAGDFPEASDPAAARAGRGTGRAGARDGRRRDVAVFSDRNMLGIGRGCPQPDAAALIGLRH